MLIFQDEENLRRERESKMDDDQLRRYKETEENLKSKSLKVFVEKYKSDTAIRTSMSPYRVQDWMTNVPLYGVLTIGATQPTIEI